MPGFGGRRLVRAIEAALQGIRGRADLANMLLGGVCDDAPGQASYEAAWAVRALVLTFLAIRAVHLSQAYLDLASGWSAYRRPELAAALAAAGIAESCWLLARSRRLGRLDSAAVSVDAAFGAIALLGVAMALHDADRTTSLNWVLPYTVDTAVGAGLALTVNAAFLLSTGLGLIYAVSVWPEIAGGHGSAATGIVNAVSYPCFCAVAIVVRTVLLYLVSQLSQARAVAVSQGEQLAAERERARHRRLIHDSALQTLEAVAHGWGDGSVALRRRAGQESQLLRQALRDDRPPGSDVAGTLQSVLGLLAAEFAGLGLQVDLVDAELRASPPGPVTAAIHAATREALVNVAKHSGVTSAVLRAATTEAGVEVTVYDRGRGFNPGTGGPGFGISHSITSAMTEVGGQAEIRSSPGAGTLVRLRGPS